MSTVYYTLEILKKEGLIQEIEFYNSDNRYDVNLSSHINLICRKCGNIKDFDEPLPFSSEMIEGRTGFRSEEMRVAVFGYCKRCRSNK